MAAKNLTPHELDLLYEGLVLLSQACGDKHKAAVTPLLALMANRDEGLAQKGRDALLACRNALDEAADTTHDTIRVLAAKLVQIRREGCGEEASD